MSSPLLNKLAVDLRNPSLRSNAGIGTPDLNLRYGTVVNWSKVSGLVDLQLVDEGLILYDVERLSNYIPTVGDQVWVLVAGPDMIVLDRTANGGPSLFAQVATGYGGDTIQVLNGFDLVSALNDDTMEWQFAPRLVAAQVAATQYGAFGASVGSQDIYIGPSGMCMIGVSAYMQAVADADNAFLNGTGMVSFSIRALSGAYTVPPHPIFGVSYSGAVPSGASVGTVHLGGGLDPGPHLFQLWQAAVGCYFGFGYRWIWVMPL
jgi:hypothetical protein